MADKPPDTIVFISELTHGGGWRGNGADDAKIAFLNGMIEASADLPAEVPQPREVVWSDGSKRDYELISAADAFDAMIHELRGNETSPQCGDCLEVVGATLAERTALTWHGDASVPVWEFEFVGKGKPMTPISFIAVRDRVGPGDWDAWGRHAPFTDGAYGTPDDTEITVAFGGGACDLSHAIDAVESDSAIVPIISYFGRPGDCAAVRVGYGLPMQLETPLGNRAVLDLENGWPVAVYPEDPPHLKP